MAEWIMPEHRMLGETCHFVLSTGLSGRWARFARLLAQDEAQGVRNPSRQFLKTLCFCYGHLRT
jgi:hypothetical protein